MEDEDLLYSLLKFRRCQERRLYFFLKLQKPLRADKWRRLFTCSQPRRFQTLFLDLHLLRSRFTDRAGLWMQSDSALNSVRPSHRQTTGSKVHQTTSSYYSPAGGLTLDAAPGPRGQCHTTSWGQRSSAWAESGSAERSWRH